MVRYMKSSGEKNNKVKSLQKRRKLTFLVESEVFCENPPFPRELTIDINNRCNHKCYFCANTKIKKYASLDTDIIYDVMQQCVKNGSTDLALQATGDPFMDKRLVNIVDKAKSLGFKYVYLNTNGALATPSKVRPLINAGLDSIKFSISAANRKDYYCDHFDYRELSNQGGSMIELNNSEYINSNNILGSLKTEEQTGKCVYPFNRIVVDPYGYVVTCTADFYNKLAVKDVRKESLIDIWNSDLFKFLRKKHLSNNLSGIYCDNCINNHNSSTVSLIESYEKNNSNIKLSKLDINIKTK